MEYYIKERNEESLLRGFWGKGKVNMYGFKSLKEIFNDLKQNKFEATNEFKEISMGMSSDYIIAIQQGATMIRVGSAIFNS